MRGYVFLGELSAICVGLKSARYPWRAFLCVDSGDRGGADLCWYVLLKVTFLLAQEKIVQRHVSGALFCRLLTLRIPNVRYILGEIRCLEGSDRFHRRDNRKESSLLAPVVSMSNQTRGGRRVESAPEYFKIRLDMNDIEPETDLGVANSSRCCTLRL